MTRKDQLRNLFENHKGSFTITIKGMDVWIHGVVVPYKNGKDVVEDRYMFKSDCGGYVVFTADDVCLVSRNDVISLYHPLEIANDKHDGRRIRRTVDGIVGQED